MKTDSRIIITLNKQFYSDTDEIIVHDWFNSPFYSHAVLTVISPTGNPVDSMVLQTSVNTTETFAMTCGGEHMSESAYYAIMVQCDGVISEPCLKFG